MRAARAAGGGLAAASEDLGADGFDFSKFDGEEDEFREDL